MATYEEIVGSKDNVDIIEVDTPEWGGKTFLRSLTGGDAGKPSKLTKKICSMRKDIEEDEASLAAWLVLCMCDKDGNRVLKESQAMCLLEGPLAPFTRAGLACAEHNGLSSDAAEN